MEYVEKNQSLITDKLTLILSNKSLEDLGIDEKVMEDYSVDPEDALY